MDGGLDLPFTQKVLLVALQSVASGSVSPEETLHRIRRWINSGQVPVV